MNCHWHYVFPVGVSPRNTAFPEAPVSRRTGLGISQPNEKKGCSGRPGQLCGRSAHGSCGNRCCRTCCIINGGCHLRDHKETQLSKNGRQKYDSFNHNNPTTTTFPLSYSQHPPLLLRADTPPTVPFGPPPNLLAERESWDDLRADTPPTFSLGPPPLPEGKTWDDPVRRLVNATQFRGAQQKEAELDRLDQEQVDAAIAASRADFQQSFVPETNQSTASSSRLRSSTPPPSPALQASQFREPSEPSLVFFSGVPVTKVPAN